MLIRSFPIYYHNSAIMAATVWNLDGEKKILYQTHCLEWLMLEGDNEKQTVFSWL